MGSLPAWSIQIRENGDKVTLVTDRESRRNILEFQRDGNTTTIMLSDEALSAVVMLAVNRAGVPVLVDEPSWETQKKAETETPICETCGLPMLGLACLERFGVTRPGCPVL